MIKFTHHYPPAWQVPDWLLHLFLILPRWIIPIERRTSGGSPTCPFGSGWDHKSDHIYARCPICSTEWLWKGGPYECGHCGFKTKEMFFQTSHILWGRIYLASFIAWVGDNNEWATLIRGFDRPLKIKNLICRKITPLS